MNQQDVLSLVLSRLDRTDVPVITIAPQFFMPPEEWASLMDLVYNVIGKVEDKTNQSFIVDIQDALWSQKRKNECGESPDGYHHIIEWNNEKVAGGMFCIHCMELFVKCNLSPEELHDHLERKGFKPGPVKSGSTAESADTPSTNTD